ncbi:MAG TPA: protein kinase [Bryobacteraceae bacterium]
MDDSTTDGSRTFTLPATAWRKASGQPGGPPYELLERLGEGGMGVVYRAHDLRLRRFVALKFLNERMTGDEFALESFWNEARAAAALDHPNICTVFDIGEFHEQAYISMAYIAGESLKKKLRDGPLPFEDVVELAMQIAIGLAVAHEAGVIHRDIKPSNILVTAGGVVKIVDFGLALLPKAGQSSSGDVSGTPAYMSPEQAHGLEVDCGTDLWSLGVTIYEMATGVVPFGKDIATVRRAILNFVGPPHPAHPGEAYRRLEPIIRRALAHDRSDRYSSAAAMIADLKSVASARAAVAHPPGIPALVVLPFTNQSRGEDTDYFSDGLTDELINALAQLDGLRVVSRSSAFEFKGKPVNIREIGAKLNVGKVVEGSVRMSGSRLRVTAQLTNVEDGFQIWSERFDREMADVFEIQDEISRAIVEKLKGRLSREETRRLNTAFPRDIEAYDLYLKGKFSWNQQTDEGFQRVIEFFTRALQVNPEFAPAHAGLADAYTLSAFHGFAPSRTALPLAQASAARALEIDPSLPDANISMGYVKLYYDWDWPEAERYLRRAVELNPGCAKAYFSFSIGLVQTSRFEEARAMLRKALDLDPCNMLYLTAAAWVEYYAKRPRVALEKLQAAMEMNADFPELHVVRGAAYEQLGLYRDAISHLETAAAAYGNHPVVVAMLGAVYASAGETERALEQLKLLNGLASQRFVPHIARAIIHMGCQQMDQAFEELRLSAEDRDAFLFWMNVYPGVEPLRSDPRFGRLLREIGLVRSNQPGANLGAGAPG